MGPVLFFSTPEDAAAARELLRELNSIPADIREALILRHVEGFDAVEIAELTGVAYHVVLRRLKQGAELVARASLRDHRS